MVTTFYRRTTVEQNRSENIRLALSKLNGTVVENGKTYKLDEWEITIKEFLPNAWPAEDGYTATADSFSVPAAFIEARQSGRNEVQTGWLSCGNFKMNPSFLILDDKYAVAMTTPEAKEFSSVIEVVQQNGKTETIKLKVNEPIHVGAWNLYQTGYDEEKGKWSTLSVIEAIRDPWIIVIYIGIFMVLSGALYIFWIGRNPIK